MALICLPLGESSLNAVYSQSWPFPNHGASTTRNVFPRGKSLNKDWIRGRIKHVPHQPTLSSDHKKTLRAKSACPRLNDRSSLPEDDSEDEVTDAVKEFKLTLQLFKRLTQQVQEVNQCTNLNRVYNFKHALVNDRAQSASPAVRRSHLAAIMSKREIPATGAPHEPICDLGPSKLITRPCSRQEKGMRTPSASSQSAPTTQSMSAVAPTPPVHRPLRPRNSNTKLAEKQRLREAEAASLADAEAKERWEDEDPDFEELFASHTVDAEEDAAMKYSYHDPYPETWVDETVEGACYRDSKNKDPFMLRIAEFEKLQEESVLWEKYREAQNKQNGDTGAVRAPTPKIKQSATNGSQAARLNHRGYSSSNRSQSARTGGSFSRAKSPNNKLRQSAWSASKASTSNSTSNQISGDESSDSVLTFRNSGYKIGVSFVPGSMYPEARLLEKGLINGQNGKNLKCVPGHGCRTAQLVLEDSKKFSKRPHCETCQAKTTLVRKHSCPKNTANTPQALRIQYEMKASEYYDIVEIARTFDPPCKAQISRAKLRPRTSVHKKADIKGMSPGKSYFSQRRISLSCGEDMAARGISPLGKTTRPSTGRCKSLTKTTIKRR